MTKYNGIWVITIVGVLLGFFLVGALGNQDPMDEYENVASVQKINELLEERDNLETSKAELLGRIKEYEASIEEYQQKAAERSLRGQQVLDELRDARMMAGLLDLEGPGIEIVLNDRKRDTIINLNPNLLSAYIVHDSDLLAVVNELRDAGAEAIAINGERILGSSRISCGGPTINVGKSERFAPPFIIHAIGDSSALASYFQKPESIYHTLVYWGLEFKIKKMDKVTIPRYYGEENLRYAKPVKEGE